MVPPRTSRHLGFGCSEVPGARSLMVPKPMFLLLLLITLSLSILVQSLNSLLRALFGFERLKRLGSTPIWRAEEIVQGLDHLNLSLLTALSTFIKSLLSRIHLLNEFIALLYILFPRISELQSRVVCGRKKKTNKQVVPSTACSNSKNFPNH